MNYEEAAAYIEETPKFTTKNSLSHTRDCLRRLGDPQKAFRVIHVAGTNGKGSTSAFLEGMIRAGGHRVGLFTSPHLVEITERFQIDRENIDQETFLRAFRQVYDMIGELKKENISHPTYFEMLFLMGMLIFAEAKVPYVVLETGLGGRLDATTAVEDPLACVITSISLDHMQYLGNTVEEIAGEKAGILVPGVPVVFDGNDRRAASVIREKAVLLGCPYYEVKKEETHILRNTNRGIDFCLDNEYYEGTEFSLSFIAEYQVMNAALALKTMEVLKDLIPVPAERLQAAVSGTRWQGRMEMVLPGVIIDGAHNEDGVEKFLETAQHFQKDYPLTLLFSAVDDKDYKKMIKTIMERISFRKVYTTQVGGYRQVSSDILAEVFRENGCSCAESVPDAAEAFTLAVREKPGDGLLFCVGSLYLVGIIKDRLIMETGKQPDERLRTLQRLQRELPYDRLRRGTEEI
ncbi:MAG: bifunctional folylpolyglutamate synthase/dihydrofolate synthase [Blautia sp.]|nr:bifunctional folylpolyglutamate synthase/dihydrofolate synthase [Blautia sp.]